MKIKRFFAKDMRAALSQVKEELGADAVIMSNKKVTGGVEIVAAVDSESANKESIDTRNDLANRLNDARRKLDDDKVQLNSPSVSRFSNVLNNLSSLSNHSAPVNEHESEIDSLSALLKRQSKHYSEKSNRNLSYAEKEQAELAYSRKPYFARKGHKESNQPMHFDRAAHSPDIDAEQKESTSVFYEPLSSLNNRLDPTRYDSKMANVGLEEFESMQKELVSIRRLLEHQVSGLMWQEMERQEPMRAMMIKRLEQMGLSHELADQLACYIPEELPAKEAWPALLDLLSDQIITTDDCILESGGVVALLGPTGVGKTTTIAKLAARAAMEFGPEQIALVTTDTFRIGAHEQLATYGRIMGCPVRVAKDAEELADILHQLRQRRLILLDTAGMGQRDIRLSEQLDTLMYHSGSKIRSFLVLPATAQRRVLHETIEHFRRIPLAGCVLTKLDESLSLGEVICMAIQHALPIAYLADGQRVPEDIKVAKGNFLVARANELLEQELKQPSHMWSCERSDNQAADFYD